MNKADGWSVTHVYLSKWYWGTSVSLLCCSACWQAQFHGFNSKQTIFSLPLHVVITFPSFSFFSNIHTWSFATFSNSKLSFTDCKHRTSIFNLYIFNQLSLCLFPVFYSLFVYTSSGNICFLRKKKLIQQAGCDYFTYKIIKPTCKILWQYFTHTHWVWSTWGFGNKWPKCVRKDHCRRATLPWMKDTAYTIQDNPDSSLGY